MDAVVGDVVILGYGDGIRGFGHGPGTTRQLRLGVVSRAYEDNGGYTRISAELVDDPKRSVVSARFVDKPYPEGFDDGERWACSIIWRLGPELARRLEAIAGLDPEAVLRVARMTARGGG